MNKKVKNIYVIKNFGKYYGRYFHCDTVCVTAEGLNQSRDRPSSRDFCVGSG